ncbi:tryptophan transporter [Tuberibacillus sp. Marseille-P3662]|uniref:tryptophan transporter n=1 Tax=Tuberibacillus sp. Marseille-P3662 TaxID=1965358 RepID=UPI000A1CCC93|nr:tryptophan transporter [Tuberibacillus sp. Marseille-P3662]
MKSIEKLVLTAILLAAGTVLNAFVPGYLFGMKPDMILIAMFLSLFLFAERKHILIIGLAAGLLSALTSTMPGGFIPNIIDKVLTSTICFTVFIGIKRLIPNDIAALAMTAVGTLLSGFLFLFFVSILASLPKSFVAMFIGVVIPAAVINTILFGITYKILQPIMLRRKPSLTPSSTVKRGL